MLRVVENEMGLSIGESEGVVGSSKASRINRFALSYHWKLTIPLSYEHHTYHIVQEPPILHCFETTRIFNDEQSLSCSIPPNPTHTTVAKAAAHSQAWYMCAASAASPGPYSRTALEHVLQPLAHASVVDSCLLPGHGPRRRGTAIQWGPTRSPASIVLSNK